MTFKGQKSICDDKYFYALLFTQYVSQPTMSMLVEVINKFKVFAKTKYLTTTAKNENIKSNLTGLPPPNELFLPIHMFLHKWLNYANIYYAMAYLIPILQGQI